MINYLYVQKTHLWNYNKTKSMLILTKIQTLKNGIHETYILKAHKLK